MLVFQTLAVNHRPMVAGFENHRVLHAVWGIGGEADERSVGRKYLPLFQFWIAGYGVAHEIATDDFAAFILAKTRTDKEAM